MVSAKILAIRWRSTLCGGIRWPRRLVSSGLFGLALIALTPALSFACACGCGVFEVGTAALFPEGAGARSGCNGST
jgi:hypothetical protein